MRPLILVPTVFEAVQVFGEGARDALSSYGHVTARYGFRSDGTFEVEFLGSSHAPSINPNAHGLAGARTVDVTIEVCGFGLAASGVGAMNALARAERLFRPIGSDLCNAPVEGHPATILIGIAGTYDVLRAPVGSVVIGTRATCDGIGAGAGDDFVAAGAMGWSQGHARKGLHPVQDSIDLATWPIEQLSHIGALDGIPRGGRVLSVAAASGSMVDAQNRRIRHAEALIEDMEAFAVALATRLSGGSLTVIRGVSNAVGDRDHRNWQTAAALGAVSRVLGAAVGLVG
ncbi:MAG: hypothetical protein EXR45_05465 [Chloroflexi bacterium]|nr:hypothetical protein [Chloroflexota bacterium]